MSGDLWVDTCAHASDAMAGAQKGSHTPAQKGPRAGARGEGCPEPPHVPVGVIIPIAAQLASCACVHGSVTSFSDDTKERPSHSHGLQGPHAHTAGDTAS